MVPELLPIPTPSRAHLRLAMAHIIDWRNQRGRALDLHQHNVALDGGRAPPPIELDDLVKLRPFAKDCRRPFEAVALAQEAIDDVDRQGRITAEVCNVPGEQISANTKCSSAMRFIATVCPDGTPNLSPKGTICLGRDRACGPADLASL